jgi:cytochrome b561
MLRNTADSWGAPAKLFHWAMAALILAQIALGLMAASWRVSPAKLELFFWHKSTGMLILLLVALRLLWRLANPTPELPAGMAAWERTAARLSHGLLYMLMVALPVTGWIVNSASNIPFRIFWLIPLPAIVAPDKPTADLAALAHRGLAALLALVLVAHIGAALRHHFVKRNTVLGRMLPGTWRTS